MRFIYFHRKLFLSISLSLSLGLGLGLSKETQSTRYERSSMESSSRWIQYMDKNKGKNIFLGPPIESLSVCLSSPVQVIGVSRQQSEFISYTN